jgi:quercetin dioxygenase-like cupin family protein
MLLRSQRPAIRTLILASVLALAFAGTAHATPPSNFVGTLTSRATLGEPVHANIGIVKLQTKGAVDFITATVNVAPGGTSGWHSHPGVVLVSVVSGSVTFYDASCAGSVHAAGSSFVESGDSPGLVRNESSTTPVVVYATYLVPAGTPNSALRVDAANPGCAQS